MLRHAECGGELKKRQRSNSCYKCLACGQLVYVGIERGGVALRTERLSGVRTRYEIGYEDGEPLMGLHNLVANGGKVLVVGGTMNKAWESFRDHPQIVFWCGSQSEIERRVQNGNNFPDNVKGVILSRFISHAQSGKVMEEAKRKRAVIFAGKNDGEVTRLLDEIVSAEKPIETSKRPEPAAPPEKVRTKRGTLGQAVAELWQPGESNIVAARRIMPILIARGITTTEQSIAQCITQLKRKTGLAKPKEQKQQPPAVATTAVQSSTPEDDLIRIIEDAMLSLQLVKDEVVRFKSLRGDYESLRNKLAALLKEA
jgi:hypothetical protein